MHIKRKLLMALMAMVLLCQVSCAAAMSFEPLPMDVSTGGPVPKDANYLSDTRYEDSSITVQIGTGRYADSEYHYAHVKQTHPSQLRTAPAGMVNSLSATFKSSATARGRLVANKVNAVVAINGDYYTKTDKCQVVMRMTNQVRNAARGDMDLLIIDKEGNFAAIKECPKENYQEYYALHQERMYQVFCFGPVLVEQGESVIADDYRNGNVGSQNKTQRAGIAQLGELEYLLLTTAGPQSKNSKGVTIPEFAKLMETIGKELSPTGCQLGFNLDGGNSTTLVFKTPRGTGNKLLYTKINSPEIERFLSDIIYFSTLQRDD